MTTSVISRNEKNSLSALITYARTQTLQGDGQAARAMLAERIWKDLYDQTPDFYKNHPSIGTALIGDPFPSKTLTSQLVLEGLPDDSHTYEIAKCISTAFAKLGIITPCKDPFTLLYKKKHPGLMLANPDWYEKNIKIIEYEKTNHACNSICKPDPNKDCVLPKPPLVKTSRTVQKRQQKIREYQELNDQLMAGCIELWDFNHSAWNAKTTEYQQAFADNELHLLKNLEQAFKQKL